MRAYFLFGEIRDRISDDEAGITLSRTWSVKAPGTVRLGIDVEFDPSADLACLFPGLYAARGLPSAARSFLGEKTTYPSSLFLSLGRRGVLVCSPSASCGDMPGSIGISRTEVEDEPPRLRVEMRFPGIEEPARDESGRNRGICCPLRRRSSNPPGALKGHTTSALLSPHGRRLRCAAEQRFSKGWTPVRVRRSL